MSKLARILIGLIVGYVAGAVIGYGLILLLSSNVHDRSLEAAMTSAFVTGPIGALIGSILLLLTGRRTG